MADEVDLFHAFRDEPAHFRGDALDGARAVPPAHLRDDAKRARVVAPFGDLREDGVRWREADAGRVPVRDIDGLAGDEVHGLPRFVEGDFRGGLGDLRALAATEDFGDDRADILHLIEPDERIHFALKLSGQLGGKSLAHAAGDDQLLADAALFEALGFVGFEDGFDALFFCGINEGARIHDEHIGLGSVVGNRHPVLQNIAEHDLGIHEVLCTAKGDHADLGDFGFRRFRGRFHI